MKQPAITSISPFFIVRNVPTALSFYCKMLGFESEFQEPAHEPFFAIVQRDGAMIFLKDVDVEALPNWMAYDDGRRGGENSWQIF